MHPRKSHAPTWVAQPFAAPVFEDDEEKTRVAKLLHTILVTFLVAETIVTVSIPLIYGIPESLAGRFTLLSGLGLIVTTAGLLILVHRGHVRVAGALLVSALWLMLAFWVLLFAGITGDGTIIVFPLVIALAGLILGEHAAVTFTLLNILVILGRFSAERGGIVAAATPSSDPYDLLVVVSALALMGLVLRYAVRSTAEGFERARRSAEALAESNRDLQASRHALIRKSKELERSNAELEQFAYTVSHDLQEPLRMVTSYLQLLERRYKGQLDEDADEFIAFAVEGATRMYTLIDDLLTYSRVGTRGNPLEPTDCNAVLNDALTNLKVAVEESDAVVTRDEMPTVMADATQLTQLFQNLVGNALKFQKEDVRPEIHVGVERSDGEWIFSVRDNGIGIDPEDAGHIFKIFQRLHSKEEYEGTGIGLAVCKKIVERHSGRIWVESEPDRGSTFYFTIPNKTVTQQ